MSNPTIISCATGASAIHALAIIRISGFSKIETFKSAFKRNFKKIKPRTLYLVDLVDPSSGLHLDQVTFIYFNSPESFTGENMLELFVHGNPINIQRIIQSFKHNFGLQDAKPGEFTLRAIKNGKMTFSQAEGLQTLLTANSNFVLNQGLEILSGDLNEKYKELYQQFILLKSNLDLLIDFSEDVSEKTCQVSICAAIERSSAILDDLVERIDHSASNLIQANIVLIGPPNAGKSTLFNKIVGKQRAIVSPVAGTTRDYIESSIYIEGNKFSVIDTAGIRQTQDSIEYQGVISAKEQLSNAFLNIYVHNPALKFVSLEQKIDLLVVTHTDIYPDVTIRKDDIPFAVDQIIYLKTGKDDGPIGPKNITPSSGPIGPGTENGGPIGPRDGSIDTIKSIISNRYTGIINKNPIVLERHATLIKELGEKIQNLKSNFNISSDMAINSFYVESYGRTVQELLGIIDTEQMLTYIFKNFCIGK